MAHAISTHLEKSFKLFLMIDFLILILSFIGTAQFANECYQLMSFAGFAALFAWFFSLMYCALSVVVFVLLGIVLWRGNSILCGYCFLYTDFNPIAIMFLSHIGWICPGHSLHDIIVFAQVGMGIIGLAYLFLRYIRTRTQPDDNIKN